MAALGSFQPHLRLDHTGQGVIWRGHVQLQYRAARTRASVGTQHGDVECVSGTGSYSTRSAGGPSCPTRPSPRAMRRTRIIRMIVGLMGSAALISISSSVMPMTDSSTMARSSWFHLCSRAEEGGSEMQGEKHLSLDTLQLGGVSQPSTLLPWPLGIPNSPSRSQWFQLPCCPPTPTPPQPLSLKQEADQAKGTSEEEWVLTPRSES